MTCCWPESSASAVWSVGVVGQLVLGAWSTLGSWPIKRLSGRASYGIRLIRYWGDTTKIAAPVILSAKKATHLIMGIALDDWPIVNCVPVPAPSLSSSVVKGCLWRRVTSHFGCSVTLLTCIDFLHHVAGGALSQFGLRRRAILGNPHLNFPLPVLKPFLSKLKTGTTRLRNVSHCPTGFFMRKAMRIPCRQFTAPGTWLEPWCGKSNFQLANQ